jgi:hypothetical protein
LNIWGLLCFSSFLNSDLRLKLQASSQNGASPCKPSKILSDIFFSDFFSETLDNSCTSIEIDLLTKQIQLSFFKYAHIENN